MTLTDDDSHLFRQAVAGCTPLHSEPRVRLLRPVVRRSSRPERDVPAVADALSDAWQPADLDPVAMCWVRPGVQHRLLRRLRRGQFVPQATLDLHGLTVAAARVAVLRFLAACRQPNSCCVRLIPGRGLGSPLGYGVLRAELDRWLRQIDAVLAYCPACRHDGGDGAVYVLLRAGPA